MQMDGKLHSCNKASSWVARATDLTKMQTCASDTVQPVEPVAYLVELEVVEKVVKFSVLLLLLELEVELLKTVKSELGLVVDVDLKRLQISCAYMLKALYSRSA